MIGRLLRIGVAMFPMLSSHAHAARESLGVFDGWGAFRDRSPDRCFAIAEPGARGGGEWRPFASIANWPGRGARGQLHIRLRQSRRPDTPVSLQIADRKFDLVAGKADAWARDASADAEIVAAMRSASIMVVTAQNERGRTFSDGYGLRGAATAIDAAALACAR